MKYLVIKFLSKIENGYVFFNTNNLEDARAVAKAYQNADTQDWKYIVAEAIESEKDPE